MMKVLLIGANGQLGQDILKTFKEPYFVIPSFREDLDITDFKKVKRTLKKIKPNLIINTAAYHKVDEIENNHQKAFQINAIAQQNISKAASEIDSTVVFISTDYVFGRDSKRKSPYHETDLPGPVNTYGLTKLAGEEMTKIYAKKYFVVRTSGLYGTSQSSQKGDNFIERMRKLSSQKNEIKVVNDQFLSPTYTLNLAQNLYSLLKTDKYNTYHMVSEGSCSWWQFTNEIFRFLKLNTKVTPVSSSFFETEARRPSYSVLRNANLNKNGLNIMNHWKINLRAYLEKEVTDK